MREKKAVNILVGANIQAAREKAGYTQERLSEIVGITPNHLSAIERGVSGASLELLQKLCGLFGVSADYLQHAGKHTVHAIETFYLFAVLYGIFHILNDLT